MSDFTMQDLRDVLETSAGEVDDVDWNDPSVWITEFVDIGYDSLALLEMVSRIRRDYGITLQDDDVFAMTTPSVAIDFINQRFATA